MLTLIAFHDDNTRGPVLLNLANVVHMTGELAVEFMMQDGNNFAAACTMEEFKRKLAGASAANGAARIIILEL